MDQLFKRKLISSSLTASFISIILPIFFHSDDGFFTKVIGLLMTGIPFVSIYIFPIILLFGNLVSVILEITMGRFNNYIFIIANGVLHITCGALVGFYFQYISFYFYGGISAGIYFIIDQILLKSNDKISKIMIQITVILLFIIGVLWVITLAFN